jgi:hypothetical protein
VVDSQDLTAEELLAQHPLQYGYRHGWQLVFDPGDDPAVVERYNRCPTCEQWSPCDVRRRLRGGWRR